MRLVKVGVGGAVLLAAAALAGAGYERVALARADRRAPPAAEMIDVGGYRLHLKCAGTGSPVVVMDGALGESMGTWDQVWPAVGRTRRVCLYDRAGLGWSEQGPLPRTSGQMADELATLLKAAHVAGPYVLVGHSLGGCNVRLFAGRYPNAVAGIVLVDSGHPEQLRRMPPKSAQEIAESKRHIRWMSRVAPFGVPRLLGECGDEAAPHCRLYFKTALAELEGLPRGLAEVGEVTSLGDTPLIVLSQDPKFSSGWMSEEEKAAWNQMQGELVGLSRRGSRVIAEGSHHYIQLRRPEVVIEAIAQVVAAARARP